MKKLFLILVLAVFLVSSVSAFGQEWHTVNQATITWSPVTGAEGGTPFPETDVIEYRVWLSNAVTDPDKTNPVEVGITEETMFVVTLNVEGRYFVGLQTMRSILMGPDDEKKLVGESRIGWSDEPEIALDGNIFGLQHYLPPLPPYGIGLL
ncbi:hypothetical protein KAW18_00975 [candidate division WOR-3 bacterium]|nr:hypothetical protein [candidate division WOR-3 bacterium]